MNSTILPPKKEETTLDDLKEESLKVRQRVSIYNNKNFL